ncbi:hypothetical protein BES08_14635 [Novosphingobium resinovorum]|uniref:Uncharacterized protein n=1 Tax=Novosphingobium resinovorum TaxID=158500 RepID=A0A1D8A6Y5_9SPHN|nr:hypothetical protein BES08_14635 [Novosphingobium resinovorum]
MRRMRTMNTLRQNVLSTNFRTDMDSTALVTSLTCSATAGTLEAIAGDGDTEAGRSSEGGLPACDFCLCRDDGKLRPLLILETLAHAPALPLTSGARVVLFRKLCVVKRTYCGHGFALDAVRAC